MKVCVIGTGYIGIVGAAVFADWGNEVVGVDIDAAKIERIKKGDMPIYEPGLRELILENASAKRLFFTTSLKEGIRDAEIVYICVGTPENPDGSANLNYVFDVAEEIAKNLNGYKVIVTKSTVPIGTNEKIKEIIAKNTSTGITFDVVSNPEFLREGSSVEDMKKTDRTIIGSDSKKALDIMKRFYQHLDAPIIECDLRSAEMVKYASNTFLATKIKFINELATLCEQTGADVTMVAKGMGLDKRIGAAFLNAGIGYGGSCFPKDVAALFYTSMDHAHNFRILKSVIDANEMQKYHYIHKIISEYGENLSGKTFSCLGLAFKNNTDDIRESVAIKVVRLLRGMGATLRVFDPQATNNARKVLGEANIVYCNSDIESFKDVDGICILTEWAEFGVINLAQVKKIVKGAVIFDGRNLLDPAAVKEAGFKYYGVGKKAEH